MGGVNNHNFIPFDRFYQIANLKEALPKVEFKEFKVTDGKIDFKDQTGSFKKLRGTLVDCYSAVYGDEQRKSWNLIFSDEEGFFKLGSSMTRIFRSLLNVLISLDNDILSKEMEISVFQKDLIQERDGRSKTVTYKNIAVWIDGQLMGRKYTEEELKEKREIKYKANGEFDKIDYSLEEDLMDAEFDTLNARLKAKLAGSDGPVEPDEVDSDIDDILAEQPQEPKKAKTVTDDEDTPF